MTRVLWIGGPSGSGKTTIARQLARRLGLRWYNSDAMTWEHRDRALRAGVPAARRWEEWRALRGDQRPDLTSDDMVAMSLHVERGPMTVADLARLPPSPLTVAEGMQVTPRIVGANEPAIWLMPSPAEQRKRLKAKHGFVPEWALAVAEVIRIEIATAHARTIVVDRLAPDDLYRRVEDFFAQAIKPDSVAHTLDERRALLRYANEQAIAQARGWALRPWAGQNSETMTRSFLCECGEPSCEACVELPIADFPAEPLIAHSAAQA